MSYPNAAARTVEDAVVAPLRNTLLQVNNLSGIRSRAREEAAVLYLDFPFGTDPDLAFIEVNEKIDQAMNRLPREVERPRVLATDVSDIPVVQLSVTLLPSSPQRGSKAGEDGFGVTSVSPPTSSSIDLGQEERERAQRASPPPPLGAGGLLPLSALA